MSSTNDSWRGAHRGLVMPTVVGAIWRLGMLVVDKWHQPLLLNDSLYYSAQARQLVDGIWFREIFVDRPGAEHGPLTSTLMATVSWLPDPVPWQRLVTVLCGIATIVLLGLVATRLAGQRAGMVTAWIAAIYPNLWMNDGLVMSESVSVVCVATVLLLTERALRRRDTRSFVWVGVAVGLAALARSELALMAPGLTALLWWSLRRDHPAAWRSAGIVLATAIATLSPWVVFNLARFERPVTLTTNDGTTLLGSYCPDTFHGPDRGGWSLVCVVADPDYRQDEEPSVRSARQRDLAITFARHHLTEVPGVVVARIGRTLDLYRLDSLVAQDVGEERYRWASWAGIVGWWSLGVVVLAGLGRIRREVDLTLRLLLALPAVSVLVTTVVFYGGHRIRSSLEPSLVVVVGVVLASWWAGRHRPDAR
jgi:4-amino-4-deoxy-L-arabinose transferase-like glycosyltransferase